MNKPVYLGLSILDISKTKMSDFWYNYIKGKYGEKANICYMDTGSFNVHLKTDDIYKDIAGDVETRLDPSNYEKIDRCLWDFKKVIRLMKGELGRKIMTIFVELKPIVIKIELKPIENKTSQFLTGEEILQSDQSRIIQQAKFIYSPLRKAFKNQVKTMEEQGKKTNRCYYKSNKKNQRLSRIKIMIIKIKKYLMNQLQKYLTK